MKTSLRLYNIYCPFCGLLQTNKMAKLLAYHFHMQHDMTQKKAISLIRSITNHLYNVR